MTNIEKAEKYLDDVINDRIITGKYVKLAVKRHLDDLKRSETEDYPYFFDRKVAERYLNIFTFLRHTKGKWRGQKFNLMPFHAALVYIVYGWLQKKNPKKRRFTKIYHKVARKNAKTEFLAGIGVIGFAFDGEKDAEIYWTATKRDQAKIGWDRQKMMISQLKRDSKGFNQYCDTSTYRIFTKEGSGFVSYLGADSHTEDGLSPHIGIGDEYHAHKTDDMVNVIESGMGTRENSQMWLITTAGFNDKGPCAQFEKICKQILQGTIENERIFAMIFEIDKEDDWHDKSCWIKANPAIPHIDTLQDFLEDEYQKALTQGGEKEINFITKNMNRWTSTFSTWVSQEKWRLCTDETLNLQDFIGKECYGGLDLASTRDLNSLCLIFPDKEIHSAFWWHWMPREEAKNRQKNDGIPYLQWGKEGLITLTDGNAVDDQFIIHEIIKLHEKFNIRSIAFDRYGSASIINRLTEGGVKTEPFGQGFLSMSFPTKEVEKFILNKQIRHKGTPILDWQISNVAIQKDPAENIKINKDKSNEKVDGIVAMVMAVGEWLGNKPKDQENIYKKRGLRVIGG